MIAGERVTLRPLEPGDVEALNAIIAEPEVRRWWGTDPTVDDQDAFTIVVGRRARRLARAGTRRPIPTTATAGWTSSSRRASTVRGSAARRCGSARAG